MASCSVYQKMLLQYSQVVSCMPALSLSDLRGLAVVQVIQDMSAVPDDPEKKKTLPAIWKEISKDKTRLTNADYEQHVFGWKKSIVPSRRQGS